MKASRTAGSFITVMAFIVLLGALSLANLFTPSREFSENENMQLQQFPKFSWSALRTGKFTADFDLYVTHQFLMRDSWISVKTLCELALGRHSSNGVYFADDGYLIKMFDSLNREQFDKNISMVRDFSLRIQGDPDMSVSTVLVPTTSYILADKLPRYAPELDQAAILRAAAEQIPGFVDISAALAAHSDEYIYYKTDHHWTSLGAFYGYADWRAQTGHLPPSLSDFDPVPLSDTFYGTNYSRASLFTASPDTITGLYPKQLHTVTVDYNNGDSASDSIYETSFLDVKDKYSVFFNANQPVTRVTTDSPTEARLLIVKDSYANTFAQLPLGAYSQLHMLDLRYYKQSVYDYAKENAITDILILYSLDNFSTDTNLYYLTI